MAIKTIRMKINMIGFLNQFIALVNQVQALRDATEDFDSDNTEDVEKLYDTVRDMTWGFRAYTAVDVGAKIIAGYIEDIANRSIELNDEKLIDCVKGLGILEETEKEQENGTD